MQKVKSNLVQYFIETLFRVLPVYVGTSDTMTPRECSNECRSRYHEFSGTQATMYCFCSDEAPPGWEKKTALCYSRHN